MGVTYIVAHDMKDVSLKNQVVRKVYDNGLDGETLIKKAVLKLLPKDAEVKITDETLISKDRKISYKPNKLIDTPIEVEEQLISVDSEELDELLNCSYAIAQDETRPVLNGICIFGNEFAALDGYRLSVRRNKFNAEEQVIVEKNLIDTIRKVKYKGEVQIYFNNSYVRFIFGDLEIIGNRISGVYIKYKSIIPEEFNTEVNIAPEELLEHLKSYKNIDTKFVSLKFSKDSLLLKVSNKEIALEDKLSATVEGSDIEIGFNPLYLIDALKNYKNEVTLKLSSPVSPIVITDNANKLDLILPVRIAKEGE